MPHTAVSNLQRDRAKTLRREMTQAETLLWRYLKAHHLNRLPFRRQVPMGAYVVDFVCHAARLVVDLDGETHDYEEHMRIDEMRDAWLASRGYSVLRVTNDQVLSSLEGVLISIQENAQARIRSSRPSLSLPRKGGRNPQTTAGQAATKQQHRSSGTGVAPSRPLPHKRRREQAESGLQAAPASRRKAGR